MSSQRIAVLPVTLKDVSRQTTITVPWIKAVADHAARYWADMSGGVEFPLMRVFEWTALPFTLAMKQHLGAAEIGDRAREAAARRWNHDTTADVFDRVIVILDDSVSTLGITLPDPILGALDVTPAVMQHEMGHIYGFGHSNLFNPMPPPYSKEYESRFCVMGREGAKYSYFEPTLFAADADGKSTKWRGLSGPGLCAPWLSRAGWLSLTDPNQTTDATRYGKSSGGGDVDVAPLHSRRSDSRNRCVLIRDAAPNHVSVMLEYRVRDGWDRGLPQVVFETRGRDVGYLVAYLTILDEYDRPTSAVEGAAIPATPGRLLHVGGAPVQAEVLRLNEDGSLRLRLRRDVRTSVFDGKPPWIPH